MELVLCDVDCKVNLIKLPENLVESNLGSREYIFSPLIISRILVTFPIKL